MMRNEWSFVSRGCACPSNHRGLTRFGEVVEGPKGGCWRWCAAAGAGAGAVGRGLHDKPVSSILQPEVLYMAGTCLCRVMPASYPAFSVGDTRDGRQEKKKETRSTAGAPEGVRLAERAALSRARSRLGETTSIPTARSTEQPSSYMDHVGEGTAAIPRCVVQGGRGGRE